MSDSPKDDGAFEPFFGSFILETLTLGMYEDSRNAIREYIQNSFDSICSAIQDGQLTWKDARIDITMDGTSFLLRDNGTGIKAAAAAGVLTSIGASRKDFRKQAGFRGIGRLAGLVFCDTLMFRTKAAGEQRETKVVFDAATLRNQMSPDAPGMSLAELLEKNIKVFRTRNANAEDHFFEVTLENLRKPPEECTDIDVLAVYLGQVAPLPYDPAFSYAADIVREGKRRRDPIEQVRVAVESTQDGETTEYEIVKPYADKVTVGRKEVDLREIDFVESKSGLYWGWVGYKDQSGAYKTDEIKGLRFRARNIQIDGTELMHTLFTQIVDAPSYGRFYEWFIGEIFVDPTRLIPNARRDGFEDNEHWQAARTELIELAHNLGKNAFKISKQGQLSLTKLADDIRSLEQESASLLRSDTRDERRLYAAFENSSKVQRKVARAISGSDFAEASQFRSLETKLISFQQRVLQKLGTGKAPSTASAVNAALREATKKLKRYYRENLDEQCYRSALQGLDEVIGSLQED